MKQTIQLSNHAAVDIMTVSSMGVRLAPLGRQPVHTSAAFTLQSTSAETNVLNIAAALGLRAKVLTRFVEGSPIAAFLKAELRKRNIQYEGPEIKPDGPWGVRHQFNIADAGFGARGPRVYNDRAGEVGRTICAEDFDTARIFGQEGCRVLHLSGLVAAMSESTSTACLALARAAKAQGTVISFDLNHRASFWAGREDELRGIFHEIASLADVLIGNEEDFQLALGMEGPEAGGTGISGKIEGFKGMIEAVAAAWTGNRPANCTLPRPSGTDAPSSQSCPPLLSRNGSHLLFACAPPLFPVNVGDAKLIFPACQFHFGHFQQGDLHQVLHLTARLKVPGVYLVQIRDDHVEMRLAVQHHALHTAQLHGAFQRAELVLRVITHGVNIVVHRLAQRADAGQQNGVFDAKVLHLLFYALQQ